MKSYIQQISLFREDGDKKVVALTPGVNIITGESKTGKSALVEIKHLKEVIDAKDKLLQEKERLINVLMNK